MTGGVYVTQDKAGPMHTRTYASLQKETHTHTDSHTVVQTLYSEPVCLSHTPSIICASTHLPKSSQAKFDLTFSNTESAGKVG